MQAVHAVERSYACIGTVRYDHFRNPAASIEIGMSEILKSLRQINFGQRRAITETIIAKRLQRRRQNNFFQSSATAENVVGKRGDPFGYGERLKIDAIPECAFTESRHRIGNGQARARVSEKRVVPYFRNLRITAPDDL